MIRKAQAFALTTLWTVLYSPIARAQSPGTFGFTGNMTTPPSVSGATLLPDGRVLIAGGGSNTLELYDPSTGTFTSPGATTTLGVGTATLLPDGRVLLAEGPAAELYDPSSGTVTATGGMIEAQTGGWTATLLQNGKVLFTGGISGFTDCCTIAANPEIYDPSTGTFSLAGSYADTGADPRWATWGLTQVPATLLADGRVLVASEPKAELYDPVTNTFSLAGTMASSCFGGGPPLYITGRTATLLPSGKVFLSGGENEDCGVFGDELYDPTTGSFTALSGPGLTFQTATLIPDGTVLITGGEVFGFGWYASNSAGLYNPPTGFVAVPNMNAGRMFHQATLLNDGRVLITGGSARVGNTLASVPTAEIYTPPLLVPAPALLSLSGDGKGQGAIQHAGTTRIASADDPAVAGEYLSIYLKGLADGSVIPPQIAVGGRSAEITFFGNVPGYPGLNVVNIRMPSGVATGSAVPVRLSYLGRLSNEVTIGVALAPALQQAVTAMKTAAGIDSLNFWQWAWYWQYLPPFNGAPVGFGVIGSISPDVMERIITTGGGDPLRSVSAERWVLYYLQAICAGCWDY